jgi:hypothetical protein
MSEKYDCTKDVETHVWFVKRFIDKVAWDLVIRTTKHDASKLQEPEKSMFDEFTPRLKTTEFGSDEYKAALVDMGEALKHHYANNRHHPEHFEDGVNGMNLIDVIEMVCDWNAAAFINGKPINLDYLGQRFGLSEQLKSIIANTLEELNKYDCHHSR